MKRLVPFLRSVCFYMGYGTVTTVMSTVFLVAFPLLPARARHRYINMWIAIAMGWLRLCCGIRYQIVGRENLPTEPAVMLANHQSAWETLLLYGLTYPVVPVVKKELLAIPLFGWGLWLQKAISIDRGKPQAAGKSLLRQGAARLRDGYSVLVFPEGTRSPTGVVGRFATSGARLARDCGAPIVPIAHNAGDCWPSRAFVKRPGMITVMVGPAIGTDNCPHTPAELTAMSENWIRSALATLAEASADPNADKASPAAKPPVDF